MPVPPGLLLLGDSEVVVGMGLLMVKVFEPEVPPPGVGLATVTGAVPAVAISVARMAAAVASS